MDCQKCGKKKGQIQVTRLIEGTLKEILLCDECLREEMKVQNEDLQTPNYMLNAILDAVSQSAIPVNWIRTTSCSQCGMTFGMYREIGKMGCSTCYQTFSDRLERVLINWHGHSVHVGKRPNQEWFNLVEKEEIIKLHKALNEAVHREDFEEAARLRDLILAMEKQVEPKND